MTWVIVDSDGNESDEIDSETEAEEQRQSMEQLGVEIVELREVDDASESELDDEPQGDDIDAEVIEMSREDGGNSTDTDDESDDIELVGDGSGRTRVYCPACGRFSTRIYRCSGCGHDLAGETVDKWEEVVNDD